MFEYSFKYLFINEPWFGTVITNCELFKHVGPNYLRDNRWKFTPIRFAGWHLSSFGNPAHVCNKMHTFAHAKDGHHDAQTTETFEQFISEGIHTDGKTKLCGSINTKDLKVIYELRCYLKHNGLFAKGQGNCIAFPITITEEPDSTLGHNQQIRASTHS
jgi:hypothetical protein